MTAVSPALANSARNASVFLSSARSLLLRMYSTGFAPKSVSSFLFLVAAGARASSTASTPSTSLICSSIMRMALVMWPGNHWMCFMQTSVFFTKTSASCRLRFSVIGGRHRPSNAFAFSAAFSPSLRPFSGHAYYLWAQIHPLPVSRKYAANWVRFGKSVVLPRAFDYFSLRANLAKEMLRFA